VSPRFSARAYQADDEAAVLALLHGALGGGRAFDRNSAFWQWKHFQNPFGHSLMTVAANGGILGLRAFLRWQFLVGPHRLSAVRAVDTATHPDYRRHGIFSTLTAITVDQAKREGIDLVFNTPNRASLPGYLKLGWVNVGKPRLWVKVLKPTRVARVLLFPRVHAEVNGTNDMAPIAPSEMLLSRSPNLEHLLADNDCLCGNSIRTNRSVSFLKWRYCSAPTLPYYSYWRGSEPSTAVAIFRPNRRRGLKEIILSELLLRRDAAADAGALVREMGDALEPDYMVATAPRGSVHARALRLAGFRPIPRLGPNLTVRVLSPLAERVSADCLARWHLSLGDLEVF